MSDEELARLRKLVNLKPEDVGPKQGYHGPQKAVTKGYNVPQWVSDWMKGVVK